MWNLHFNKKTKFHSFNEIWSAYLKKRRKKNPTFPWRSNILCWSHCVGEEQLLLQLWLSLVSAWAAITVGSQWELKDKRKFCLPRGSCFPQSKQWDASPSFILSSSVLTSPCFFSDGSIEKCMSLLVALFVVFVSCPDFKLETQRIHSWVGGYFYPPG